MGSDRLLSEVGDSSMDLMGMYKWECNWECDMRVSITGGSPKMMFLFFFNGTSHLSMDDDVWGTPS